MDDSKKLFDKRYHSIAMKDDLSLRTFNSINESNDDIEKLKIMMENNSDNDNSKIHYKLKAQFTQQNSQQLNSVSFVDSELQNSKIIRKRQNDNQRQQKIIESEPPEQNQSNNPNDYYEIDDGNHIFNKSSKSNLTIKNISNSQEQYNSRSFNIEQHAKDHVHEQSSYNSKNNRQGQLENNNSQSINIKNIIQNQNEINQQHSEVETFAQLVPNQPITETELAPYKDFIQPNEQNMKLIQYQDSNQPSKGMYIDGDVRLVQKKSYLLNEETKKIIEQKIKDQDKNTELDNWLEKKMVQLKQYWQNLNKQQLRFEEQQDIQKYLIRYFQNNFQKPQIESFTQISSIKIEIVQQIHRFLYEQNVKDLIQDLQTWRHDRLQYLQMIAKNDQQQEWNQQKAIYHMYKVIHRPKTLDYQIQNYKNQIDQDKYFTLIINISNKQGLIKTVTTYQKTFDGLVILDLNLIQITNQQFTAFVDNFYKFKDLRILIISYTRLTKITKKQLYLLKPVKNSQKVSQNRLEQLIIFKPTRDSIIEKTNLNSKMRMQNLSLFQTNNIVRINQRDQSYRQAMLSPESIKNVIQHTKMCQENQVQFEIDVTFPELRLDLKQIKPNELFNRSLKLNINTLNFSWSNIINTEWSQLCSALENFKGQGRIEAFDFSSNKIHSINSVDFQKLDCYVNNIQQKMIQTKILHDAWSFKVILKNNPLLEKDQGQIRKFYTKRPASYLDIVTDKTSNDYHIMRRSLAQKSKNANEKFGRKANPIEVVRQKYKLINFLRSKLEDFCFQQNKKKPDLIISKQSNFDIFNISKCSQIQQNNCKNMKKFFDQTIGSIFEAISKEKNTKQIQKNQFLTNQFKNSLISFGQFWIDINSVNKFGLKQMVNEFNQNIHKFIDYKVKQQNATSMLRFKGSQIVYQINEKIKLFQQYLLKWKQSILSKLNSLIKQQQKIKDMVKLTVFEAMTMSLKKYADKLQSQKFKDIAGIQGLKFVLIYFCFDNVFSQFFQIGETIINKNTKTYIRSTGNQIFEGIFYLAFNESLNELVHNSMSIYRSFRQIKSHYIHKLITFYVKRLKLCHVPRYNFLKKIVEYIPEMQQQQKNWELVQIYQAVTSNAYPSYKIPSLQYNLTVQKYFGLEIQISKDNDLKNIEQDRKKIKNLLNLMVKNEFEELDGFVRITLSSCKINDDQFAEIIQNIQKLKQLRKLDLAINNITTVTENQLKMLLELKYNEKNENKIKLSQINLTSNPLTKQSRKIIDKFNKKDQITIDEEERLWIFYG